MTFQNYLIPPCSTCKGSGINPKGPLSMSIGGGPDFDCFACGGSGQARRPALPLPDNVVVFRPRRGP